MNVETFFKAEKIRGATALAKARRAVHVRSEGRCEARCCDDCTGQFEHAHHRRLTAQGGNDTAENLLAVCHRCHNWIHAHPGEARELGLIVWQFDPAPAVGYVVPATRLYDQDAEA